MRSLATIDPAAVNDLVARLTNAGIACEIRAVTEEGGIAATELFVDDSRYDAACDVVDAWLDDEARKARLICPKCRSPHLERVSHDSVEVSYKCRDCGCEVLAKA